MTPEQARRVADATAALAARFQRFGVAADEAGQAAQRFIDDLRAHGWRPIDAFAEPPSQPTRLASDDVRRSALEDMRRAVRHVMKATATGDVPQQRTEEDA